MKLSSIICILFFTFTTSVIFAQGTTVDTFKCKEWEKVTVQVEKAPVKSAPKKVYKPLPQKIADIKPQDYNCPKEKKNMFILQPGLMFAYSREFKQPAVIPTMGIVYLRDITPTFSMGPGIQGAYAFYHRSFNMIGFNINFAFKF